MAIIDARILRSLTFSESKSDKQTVQYSGTEEYLIISDAKDPSFGDILADTTSWTNLGGRPLPQIDDEVTLNGIAIFVTSRELSYYEDNERAVVMRVKYDAKKPEASEPEEPTSTEPNTWKRITVQTEQVSKPAVGWARFADIPEEDALAGGEGSPPVNSAGFLVDGIEEDSAIVRATYTNTQVANPNFAQLIRYTNRCNDNDFLGGAQYTVRMCGFTAEYDHKNNVWAVSVEFKYNPDGWWIQYADAGRVQVDANGKRAVIVDYYGNPIPDPVPLDGSGAAVADNYYTSANGPGGGAANGAPPPNDLYLYPYKKANMDNIWSNCGI